ncbi:MAG: hypothetical protein ABSG28_03735 [Methanoregula sp.]|jgi:hypothetical protein|uniref:hypothetical protein n=1 Tax=Methanoregula sp. TaxID=2052170 RepID=UPI003C19B32B
MVSKPSIHVIWQNTVYPWWWKVAYLILHENFGDLVTNPVDEAFGRAINAHVNAYLNKGTMPPTEIAATVMNLADDVMAGRKMTIRAGDYIAVQNYMKKTAAGK